MHSVALTDFRNHSDLGATLSQDGALSASMHCPSSLLDTGVAPQLALCLTHPPTATLHTDYNHTLTHQILSHLPENLLWKLFIPWLQEIKLKIHLCGPKFTSVGSKITEKKCAT